MAAVLRPATTAPPNHPSHHQRRHQNCGILLPSAPQPTNSPYISSSSASSSAASSSSFSHTSLTNTPPSSAPCSRRIRFAPLPDPRRLVIINDDGTETPLPEDATHYPSPIAAPQDDSLDADNESISSSGSASKRNSFTGDSAVSTPGTMTPISTSPEDTLNPGFPAALTTSLAKSSGSSSLTKSLLFRPWSKKPSASSSSSTYSLTPTASHEQSICPKGTSFPRMNISTEEILTLGTINLFRASSRDRDSDNTSGWGLQRWTSAGSGKEPTPSWGAPLARSQSSQSYKDRKSSFLSLPSPLSGSSSTKSKSKSRPPPSSFNSRLTGTRMLNGRIYGGPRRPNGPPKNPFANVRDEDPEFVEWGYGGMGSVKTNAGNTTMWNKLQSDGRGVVVGDNAEEDDGSGMGWVRRRREERERAQKTQEEGKEQQEPEQTEETEDTQNDDASAPSAAAGEAHVLRAVNIPAPLPRHPHHRSNSRTHVRTSSADLSILVGEPTKEEQKADTQIVADSGEDISESESESESASGDNKGDDEDDFDDDEDDEDDDDVNRMTSLCAGVEKISRHKEASAAEDKEGESKNSR